PAKLRLRWSLASAAMLAISAFSLHHYPAPIPNPLTIDLVLEQPGPGKSEPIITTGRLRAGDFLFVRFLDQNAVVFGYEAWSQPQILSNPVTLPPNERVRVQLEMPALTQVRGMFAPTSDQVRIVANGREVLHAPVNYHVRLPSEIYFGENPIGGTACD